jgi:hypothetical protein
LKSLSFILYRSYRSMTKTAQENDQ